MGAFPQMLLSSCNRLPATELKGRVSLRFSNRIKWTSYQMPLPAFVCFLFASNCWNLTQVHIYSKSIWRPGWENQCGSMPLSFVNSRRSLICGTICHRHMLLQRPSINHRPSPAAPRYEAAHRHSNLSKTSLMGWWQWRRGRSMFPYSLAFREASRSGWEKRKLFQPRLYLIPGTPDKSRVKLLSKQFKI